MQATMRPAVFLDRDGVINENRGDYVKSWSEVQFLPGVFDALRQLRHSGYAVVLVTNQSAIGRGIITHEQAAALNERIVAEIAGRGGRIDATYLCHHHPAAGCACRKPAPGMLLQAARDLGLDLRRSYLVGDALSDLEAARAAGARGILVLTGRGREQRAQLAQVGGPSCTVARDLLDALSAIPDIPGALDALPLVEPVPADATLALAGSEA